MTEAGWTRTKPTVAGWYWYKDPDYPVPTILHIQVILEPTAFWGSGVKHALKSVHGEWLGPLSPDSFQQGRVAGLREAVKQLHEGVRLAQSREVADALSGHAYTLDRIAQQAQEGK